METTYPSIRICKAGKKIPEQAQPKTMDDPAKSRGLEGFLVNIGDIFHLCIFNKMYSGLWMWSS